MAASEPHFPAPGTLCCVASFLSHLEAQRAGETVAVGDHSCGEAASACGQNLPPGGEELGFLGPADGGSVL